MFVTYAKQDKAKHDSVSGRGLGAVQQIDITGKVHASFAHGKLNAPWGMAIAPAGFGGFTGHLLVRQFRRWPHHRLYAAPQAGWHAA